ncbi:MAG: hypothetical protein J7L19_07315 [Dehalococcoidia bacterium]|nr:hypothetical protein [Dehalococcoidia bacterium]
MEEKFAMLDKYIKSKQMIVFLIFMTLASILFYPILNLRRRRSLELQESIKAGNCANLGGSCGISLDGVE